MVPYILHSIGDGCNYFSFRLISIEWSIISTKWSIILTNSFRYSSHVLLRVFQVKWKCGAYQPQRSGDEINPLVDRAKLQVTAR